MARRFPAPVVAIALLSPVCAAAAADEEAVPEQKSRKPTFGVVPGPFYNPNQGLGVMVIGMGMFHPSEEDLVSPPSIVALVGMYGVLPPLNQASTRYTWAVGALLRVSLIGPQAR